MGYGKKYVLIIDDEADFLETTSFWLRSKGYEVRVAPTGVETLNAIKADEPYLIFLDLNMPEMDGVQMLGEIRKINRSLSVIMVSAFCDDLRMEKAKALGISGIFPKYGTFEELGNVLEVGLRTHRQK